MLKASLPKNVIFPSFNNLGNSGYVRKGPFLINYTHERHCIIEQWQIRIHFCLYRMFLYSLNSCVSHVLHILSLKSSKAHSEDGAPGSEEAVQSSAWVLPSQLRGGPAVWPGRGGPLWPQWYLQTAHVEGRPACSESQARFTPSTWASKGLLSRWWAPGPQGDSIHGWRALLSQGTRQRDFTPMGRWPLLSTEKEGQKKKTEQVLERKTSLQREGNHGRKNSSSKYSAESKMLHGEPRICRYCHAPLHPSCEQMSSSWCKTLWPSQRPEQRRAENMPVSRYQGPPARRTCLLLGLKEAEAAEGRFTSCGAGATQQPTRDPWSKSACALRRYLKIKYSLFS